MYGEKTDDDIKFERAVALKAIAAKAKDLQNEGAAPFEVQTFINGSRRELANEAPDPELYSKALKVAATQKASRQ
jgi:hypothetical protein